MAFNLDPAQLEQIIKIVLQIIECLQDMDWGTRSRLFRVVASFSGEPILAPQLEKLFDSGPEAISLSADWAKEKGADEAEIAKVTA